MKRLFFLAVVCFGIALSCRNRAIESVPLVPTSEKENDPTVMTDSLRKALKAVDTLSNGKPRL